MAQMNNVNNNTKDGGQQNDKRSSILMITLNDLKYVSNLFETDYYNQLLSLKSQISGKQKSIMDDGKDEKDENQLNHDDIEKKLSSCTQDMDDFGDASRFRCGLSIESKHSLKSAIRGRATDHHSKPLSAPYDRSYNINDIEIMNKPLSAHAGGKWWRCTQCKFSTKHESNFVIHRRTHTGEKPFWCQICDMRFGRKDYLIKHTRTHTGERPYQCMVCYKAFRQRSALTSHCRHVHKLVSD